MMSASTTRLVVDTNVVFEGLTKASGASGLLVEASRSELFVACVSTPLLYEYLDVFSRKLSPARWERIQRGLGTLISHTRRVTIHYSWRPMSTDPADDHVIDCAMNARAALVTWNIRDFRTARDELGLVLLTPVDVVAWLAKRGR